MDNHFFRQESLDRISSPEQMRDYMRVTSPRLWMLLAAIVALLVGFLVYASTTRMENTTTLEATVGEDGFILAELPGNETGLVEIGMPVRIGGKNGKVTEILTMMESESDTSTMLLIDLQNDARLPEGVYQAEIVTESISPIGFLMN